MSSSSSSAQAAWQRLADQLRELRQSANISGVRFAELAGWSDSSTVTKIEKGRRRASAAHVRLWCEVCGASEQRTEELLAEQRAATYTWSTNQELKRGGLRRAQEEERGKYENARLMRFYAGKGIPGLLQTEAYAAHALRSIRMELGVDRDDVAEAVAERMARNAVLRKRGRFAFVLEEEVLRHRTCPASVHHEQLVHLLAEMRRPAVSLGVIPWARERTVNGFGVWPDESFLITDERLVNVELVSGYLSVTNPGEVAVYVQAWRRLAALAVHGESAAALIRAAMCALEER